MVYGTIAQYGSLIAAVVAAFALLFSVLQTRRYRRFQQALNARDRYQNFLQLSIQYPQFAPPPEKDLDFKALTFGGDHLKFIQYEWFLWSCLNAVEGVFFIEEQNKYWRLVINTFLKDHKAYLASDRMREFAHMFAPKFRSFIRPWLPQALSAR